MKWRNWFGLLISAVALYLAVREVSLREVIASFTRANYAGLVGFTVISFLAIVLRAYRWYFLLRPHHRCRFQSLYFGEAIGFMSNNLLPARLGEFVRAFTLSRREPVGTGLALGTMLVERFFDGLILAMILVAVPWVHDLPPWVIQLRTIATVLMGVAILLMILLVRHPEAVVRFSMFCSQFLPRRGQVGVGRWMRSFLTGTEMLKDVGLVVRVAFLTVVLWIFQGWGYKLALDGFGVSLPLGGPYFVQSFVNFGIALPSSPAFIGTFEFFFQKSLSLFAIPQDLALSAAIGVHLAIFLPTTLAGIVCLSLESLTLEDLKAQEVRRGGDER